MSTVYTMREFLKNDKSHFNISASESGIRRYVCYTINHSYVLFRQDNVAQDYVFVLKCDDLSEAVNYAIARTIDWLRADSESAAKEEPTE